MMPRKKRRLIIIVSVVLVVLMITVIGVYLFLETDLFKSNETLFAKYLLQNVNIIETLSEKENIQTTEILENNKYISNITGDIQYTEDINTSNENTNDIINNIKLKIVSNTDKTNNYYYKDIQILNNEDSLAKAEYINNNNVYGIRLNGIKQFVSIDSSKPEEYQEKVDVDIEKLKNKLEQIELDKIMTFTEEEKQVLQSTYLSILQKNVSKDRYYKQANSLITVNNKDVQVNAYYIKLTIEEFNDLYIKILDQVANYEIILSKIDEIESIIKEKYSDYETEETLREKVINYINTQIQKIQNNNIGQDEVRITVYENNRVTIRTSIEKNANKLILDNFNNIIKIDNLIVDETESEQIIQIQKINTNEQKRVEIEFEDIRDNEMISDYIISYDENSDNNLINKNLKLEVRNQKYKVVAQINEEIKIVDQFEKIFDLKEDNIDINQLSKEQVDGIIMPILEQNIQKQMQNVTSIVTAENYKNMLRNLEIIKKSNIQISDTATVTDTERNRYNSQFEFFVSENLSKDNIRDLIEVATNNFYEMKILLKDGNVMDLDVSKIQQNSSNDSKKYIDNISELIIYLKQNTNNVEKKNDMLTFLEKNGDTKYSVNIQYNDENGLAQLIRIKIQEEE